MYDLGYAHTLAAAIAAEPRGIIVAGALPVSASGARDALFQLATRAGYRLSLR